MRYLSADALDLALPMPAAIAAMRAVFADLSNGVVPERVFMEQPRSVGSPAWLGAMPAGWSGHGFGAKIVSLVADNPAAGRPAIQGIAVLLDADTGAPVLLCDAAALTARRTAAMVGLATDALAGADAQRLGVVGAGALAGEIVAAIQAVREVREVVLFNRTASKAAALADTLGGNVRVADSADAAATAAEILVLCTASRTPLVADESISDSAHINAVGNYHPTASELELRTVARSSIWVDTFEGALSEAGELLLAAEAGLIPAGRSGIRGDLSMLATAAPPRSVRGPTLYKSVGSAIADIGAMVAARAAAEQADIGTPLD